MSRKHAAAHIVNRVTVRRATRRRPHLVRLARFVLAELAEPPEPFAVHPNNIEIHRAGRRLVPGTTIAIPVAGVRGLAAPQAFRLDLHNVSGAALAAGAVQVGLVLPALLSIRPADAVILPDGRPLHLGAPLGAIPADGWAPVEFRHQPSDPKRFRGRRLAAEVRLFAGEATHTTAFFLRLAQAPPSTSALIDLRNARAHPLPVPLHPSTTPQGAFANRVLGYLGADENFSVYAKMRPDAWFPSGEYARAAIERGVPDAKIRQQLERSWGSAADAILRAARDALDDANS